MGGYPSDCVSDQQKWETRVYIYIDYPVVVGELRSSVYQYSNIFHIQWAAKDNRMIDDTLYYAYAPITLKTAKMQR
jgi:hypothetical protein